MISRQICGFIAHARPVSAHARSRFPVNLCPSRRACAITGGIIDQWAWLGIRLLLTYQLRQCVTLNTNHLLHLRRQRYVAGLFRLASLIPLLFHRV
jgi:hypothetical protein